MIKKVDMINKDQKRQIKEALIEYGEKIKEQESLYKETEQFTNNEEANRLLEDNPVAFLFGVILDQSIRAERAWKSPLKLKRRLGHLDIEKIAKMKDEEIKEVFNKKPKIHRFNDKMALCIKKASQLIINRYDGKVENVWSDNPRARDLQNRFEEFRRIGQKKASMAVNILVRRFGADIRDKRGIDVSYDIHVRRVFLRTGLVGEDDKEEIIRTARKLNPEYPGKLDYPAWTIGRRYCHYNNPKCSDCPISEECLKLTERKVPKGLR